MKTLIILFALSFTLMAQDWGMIQKHLEKQDEILYPKLTVSSNGDTTYYWYVYTELTDNLKELKKEYLKIYREEYLRMIAKKFLEKQFKDDDFEKEYWEKKLEMDRRKALGIDEFCPLTGTYSWKHVSDGCKECTYWYKIWEGK